MAENRVENASALGIGVVGLGSMAHRHATLVERLGHHVVAGADVSPDARDQFEKEFDRVVTYETHEAMYDDVALDAVVITTPNKYHEPAAVDAFERDIGLLCEKPLAHSLESAERIAAAHEASDGVGMVGFHNRFEPVTAVARDLVENGTLGRMSHIEATLVRRRGVPGRGTWFVSRDLAGGGALIDIGVHILDLALAILDFPEIEHVAGTTRREFGHRGDYTYLHMWGQDAEDVENFDVEDSATALIRTVDGRTVSLEVAWASNSPDRTQLRLRGAENGATLDLRENQLTLHETGDGGRNHHADTEFTTADVDAKEEEMAAFLDAVACGRDPEMNTVDQALTVQRVLDAIYHSSENSGETVDVST